MEKKKRLTLAVVVVISLLSITLSFWAMMNVKSFSIPSIRIELGDMFREWDRKRRIDNQESAREPAAKQVDKAHEGFLTKWDTPIKLDSGVYEDLKRGRIDAQKTFTKWSESDLQRINAILSTCQKDADGSRFATCFGPSGGKPTCFCMKTP